MLTILLQTKTINKIFKKIVEGLGYWCKKICNANSRRRNCNNARPVIAGKGFAYDLAGMVVGIVSKKDLVLGNKIKTGDVIIGAKSSGLHSNGYSLARTALLTKYTVKDKVKGVGVLGNALTHYQLKFT